jgi:hypothetical protein
MNIIKKIENPFISFILGMLLVLALGVFSSSNAIGGTTNYDDLAVDSITVTGVSTLSGGVSCSGAITAGAGVSGTTGTFTSSVATGLLTSGGGVLSTSTASTAFILKASDLNYSLLQVTPNTDDLTYTFPASSTLSAMIPNAGDTRTITVYNATTTATIDVIFAAGTGMEIKSVGGAALTIDESSFGTLKFIRKANSDILVLTAFPTAD